MQVSIVDERGKKITEVSNGYSKYLVDEEKSQQDANIRFNAFAHAETATSVIDFIQ